MKVPKMKSTRTCFQVSNKDGLIVRKNNSSALQVYLQLLKPTDENTSFRS